MDTLQTCLRTLILRMNSGKLFEEDFRLSCKNNVGFIRLFDPIGGQQGVVNICDYIVSGKYTTLFLELKATSTGTLPITNISKNQYNGLLEQSKYPWTTCGILVKFIKFEKHYFVNIKEVARLKELGIKSIAYKKILSGEVKAIPFPAELKRTRYSYDVLKFVSLKEFE